MLGQTLSLALVVAMSLGACQRADEARASAKSPGEGGRAMPQADGGPPAAKARARRPRVVLVGAGGQELSVTVELARTDGERRRGLMYRQHLAPDEGMLFLFDQDELHTFWMRNTLIPLDMIFIRADMTVAGVVERAEPLTTESRGIDEPSRYVLEVNGGFARAHGVGPGTRVRFENIPGFEKGSDE